MRSLPSETTREHIHTRTITTKGFRRDDGLWDIEGELTDIKTHPSASIGDFSRDVGQPIHHMKIRLTVDDAFKVHNALGAMPSSPFAECLPALMPFQGMIGVTIGPGWRKAIDSAMGGIAGCTHMRELLAVMATVVYQTIPGYRRHERSRRGESTPILTEPTHQMGKCITWDFNGAVIARVAPQFIGFNKNSK